MIRKITLENFMSHRYTVIEPARGLTVLVGENNCGKSAVVAALQILCNNASGEYMVRHGQSNCRVTVETDDGHVVEWRRSGGIVSYVLNGESVYRLRGAVPDDLHKYLRMPLVHSLDGVGPFDVHFGEQKKPVFLLDVPGTHAAKFFASSSDAEALIRMQSLHRKNTADATKRSNWLLEQLARIDSHLQPLRAIAEIQDRLDELDAEYATLEAMGRQLENLDQSINVLGDCIDEGGLLKARVRVTSKLETPPCMADTDVLAELTEGLSRWLEILHYEQLRQKAMHALQVPPRQFNTAILETLVQSITQTEHQVFDSSKVTLALSALGVIPSLVPTIGLESICEELSRCIAQTSHTSETADCLARLPSPPKLFDFRPLLNRIAEIEAASNSVLLSIEKTTALGRCEGPPKMRHETALDEIVEKLERFVSEITCHTTVCAVFDTIVYPPSPMQLGVLEAIIDQYLLSRDHVSEHLQCVEQVTALVAEAEQAIRNWVEEHPICPTCGAELDPERLIALKTSSGGGHAHV